MEGGEVDAPQVYVLPEWSCYKCDEALADERSLKRHLRSNNCIGIWYVCKRCLDFFDKPSDIKRHQNRKRGCAKAVLGGKIVQASTTSKEIPLEVVTAVRLKRGATDAGGMSSYLDHVAKRGNHQEIKDVLQACNIGELVIFLERVNGVSDDIALFIDIIAVLADYSNTELVSPEKKAILKAFVNFNITL